MDNVPSKFEEHYSDKGFWSKLGDSALKAGKQAVRHSLTLYYTMHEPGTPSWAKSVIIGALGYFILPLDAIPDMLPGVGFTDDLGVLAAAIATVEMHITPAAKARADRKLAEWFRRTPVA
jgi:uncharacterized membrane protein YkvA (DUF1232 family)